MMVTITWLVELVGIVSPISNWRNTTFWGIWFGWGYHLVGGWATYPSEKSWSEFVSWDDEIPNCFWKNPLKSIKQLNHYNPLIPTEWKVTKKSMVPNHQPDIIGSQVSDNLSMLERCKLSIFLAGFWVGK